MDSQVANLQNVAALGDLVFANYKGRVEPHLEFMGPTLSLFRAASAGEFELTGKELRFAARLKRARGARSTSGQLPDHDWVAPTQLVTTPTETYVRRAWSNFTAARAQGNGTFGDLIPDIMDQLWEAMELKQNRDVHGSSTGFVCKCESRTDDTTVVVKDAYGHAGSDPLMYLEVGETIAWLDASDSYKVGGIGTISAITPSTRTIDLAADWENGAETANAQITAGDPIVFVTTSDESASYFATEYGLCPIGLQDMLDPAGTQTSYLGVTLAGNERLKPVNVTSASFGEIEFMEWKTMIRSKGGTPVTPESHAFVAQPGIVLELAKTLTPYTQIQTKGQPLPGGWTTVDMAGHTFVEDEWAVHNALQCLCREDLRTIPLDGDARMYSGDGSERQRLADFNGEEVFAFHYVQRLMARRNRSGCLKSINVTSGYATKFSPTPNY